MRADRRKNQKRNKKLKEKKARRDREECSDGEGEVEEMSGEGPIGGIEAQCHDQEEFLKLLAQNHAFR